MHFAPMRNDAQEGVRNLAAQPEPITISIKEALRISGLGLTKIYELINDGRLETVKVDNRRLVNYESLKSLLSGAGADKRPILPFANLLRPLSQPEEGA
jgi:excisionase family DNA binding protein